MQGYVYTLSDPRTGEVRYVGLTIDVDSRFRQHLNTFDCNGQLEKAIWIDGLRKEGLTPALNIVKECPYVEAEKEEAELIRSLIAGGAELFNKQPGGTGRGSKKLQRLTKAEWFAVGYQLKAAREAALEMQVTLSELFPLSHPAVRAAQAAVDKMTKAIHEAEGKVYVQYPEWREATSVFFGNARDIVAAYKRFAEEH